MTTIEFYNFAVIAAKNKGYENPDISVITICNKSGVQHVCKLWDNEKKKHIESKLHKNPVASLQAFKDAIEFENKTYSELSEGLEL